jgi:glycosyltransferase involved in cell wall biosynthesis
MTKFYSIIDCLVVPSHWEPMGMTEIEAMAMKIPVIAADVAGLNEIVIDNETGKLFKARDINDLINNMMQIYSDNNLRLRITDTAFANLEIYTYESFQCKLNEIYKNIN